MAAPDPSPARGPRERLLALAHAPGSGPPPAVCADCGHTAEGRFCPACGLDKARGRLTVRGVLAESAHHVVGLDSTLGRTLARLLVAPGELVRDYVAGRRRRYVGPARLALVTLATWLLVSRLGGLDPMQAAGIRVTNTSGSHAEVVAGVREILTRHLDLLLYLALPLRAALYQLLFRRSGRNLAESLTLVLYVASFGYLVGLALTGWTALGLPGALGVRGLLVLVWSVRAAAAFYERGLLATTWRVAVVSVLHVFGTVLLFAAVILPWVFLTLR